MMNDEMTIEQLVDYLPDITSKQTVYDWVYRDVIPYHKLGKRLLFDKTKIDKWNQAGRPKND